MWARKSTALKTNSKLLFTHKATPMESDNMKDLWKEENKQLDQKLKINEDALKKKALDKSVSEFDTLLSFSILGRYVTLVYCVISLVTVIPIIDQLLYS